VAEDVKARADEVAVRPTKVEGSRPTALNAATLLLAASNGEASRSLRAAVEKFISFVYQTFVDDFIADYSNLCVIKTESLSFLLCFLVLQKNGCRPYA